MAFGQGINKQVRYKVQTGLGTIATTAAGEVLRRVTSSLDLVKATYQSNEVRADAQIADYRHGVREVAGQIKGELSPGSYDELFSSILRRDFTTVTSLTGVSITVAVSGTLWTLTRAAGSWLTDGVKNGDVIRLSVGALNAANINKNLMVVNISSATVMTVTPLNGVALVAEGPIATCTVTWPGKKTFAPVTGLTDKYFTFEHWFSDIAQSEQFVDCKVGDFDINIPATGMVETTLGVKGLGFQTGTIAYFTAPTAAGTSGVLASVNGVLLVNGAVAAIVTSMSMKGTANLNNEPVVGANVKPDVFRGRTNISGQFTAYFVDATLRDLFVNETESSISVAFTTSNSATADFVQISLPRIKIGAAGKDDGEKGLIQTFPFQALLATAGGAGVNIENTTMSMQDSLAA